MYEPITLTHQLSHFAGKLEKKGFDLQSVPNLKNRSQIQIEASGKEYYLKFATSDYPPKIKVVPMNPTDQLDVYVKNVAHHLQEYLRR